MTDNKWITAEDLLAQLNSDPDWVARRAAQEQKLKELEARLAADAEPLLTELAAAGVKVSRPWELEAEEYRQQRPQWVPILLKHLPRPYLDKNKASMAMALTVPEDSIGWSALMREYTRAHTEATRCSGATQQALARALAMACDTSEKLADLLPLIEDSQNGDSRTVLVYCLADLKKRPDVKQFIRTIATDPDLTELVPPRFRPKDTDQDKQQSKKVSLNVEKVQTKTSDEQEASTDFDMEYVERFLLRLPKFISTGFDQKAVGQLMEIIRASKHEQEKQVRFRVKFGGKERTLRIVLFLSDIDNVTIYFFTSSDLATRIGQEMEAFSEENGM